MDCPKCRKPIDENDVVCPNCGTQLRPDKDTSIIKKFRKNDDKYSKKPKNTGLGKLAEQKRKLSGSNLKIVLFAIALVLLVVLVVLIVVNVVKSKGESTAEKISQYIGADVGKAQKSLDMHFKDESVYQGVNNALNFDYIVEADDSVKVDGISYPEWAALVTVDDKERIESVKYADFSTLKKDSDGEEKSKAINLDKFEKGAKWSDISSAVDLDYYGIIWNKDTKTYVYRYWYENDAGDRQPVVLNAVFDTDNKYLYYTSTPVYPQNL